MGVIVPGSLAVSVNAVLEMESLPAGSTSIVSQSGTMLGTCSRAARRGALGFQVGFRRQRSRHRRGRAGRASRRGRARASSSFSRDGARRRACRAARKAHAAGKAIVAYKLGRSTLGEKAALSHTGALAGTDAALDAYFRDCGIVRVDMLETLLEIAPLLAGRKPPDLSRPGKVFVVTTTGGGAASVVDRLGMHGVELAAPIMDLTMAGTGRNYADALEKGARTDCDAVVACVGSSAQFHPDIAVEPIIHSPKVKPVVAFFTPQADRSLALAAAHAIPAFRTPEACADALAAFFSWRSPRATPRVASGSVSDQPFELLANLGIPVAPWAIAEAPDFAHRIAYPVAVKTLEAHKTERGGVILGVANDAELGHRAAALGNRVLVQRMERGLLEAIVGYRRDPVVGPVVLVGMGA